MASSSGSTEFAVVVPKDVKKVFNVLRFAGSSDVPNLLKTRKMFMKREDNSRIQAVQPVVQADSKEAIPKTGAGSEFGRDEREERARRLRGGRTLRKYNPDDQPWISTFTPQQTSLKDVKPSASTTRPRRFRGLREAGATENASWFIFAQIPEKGFLALPINEWYGFTAMTQYEHLNSEEVEEEYQKRKKTLNFFTLMLQKRLKNQEMEPGELEAQVKAEASAKGRKGAMHLTDLDAEWVKEEEDAEDSDFDDVERKPKTEDGPKIADADAEVVLPDPKKKIKKKAQEILRQKKRLRSKTGEDEESDISDSDEGDFDGREMDYMTSSGAESEFGAEDLPDEVKEEIEAAELGERGVEDEDGLRKLNDSGEEDEDEEEDNKESKDDDFENEEKESRSRQGGSSSDSGGDESGNNDDSDSDIDGFEMSSSGRQNQGKRRMAAEVITASGKRVKLELPSSTTETAASTSSAVGTSTSSQPSKLATNDIDAQLEQAIRHYLSRTPMSATQLVEKFMQKARSASASGGPAPPTSQDLAKRIAAIILRLKPEQIKSGSQVFFSLSPDTK